MELMADFDKQRGARRDTVLPSVRSERLQMDSGPYLKRK